MLRVLVPFLYCFFFLMIRRPPRSTLDRSSAASDVYKRQVLVRADGVIEVTDNGRGIPVEMHPEEGRPAVELVLSLIHISEPTRPY